MMKLKKIFAVGLSVALVMAMSSPVFAAVGSSAALADKDYTLEEMLTYAIQDEYAAQAEYNAIIVKYGTQRPFTNIVNAEATHINLLLPLFEEYKLSVPVNNAEASVVVPASLQESYTTGAKAEVNNIAMYEGFLKEKLPDDVKSVFERLKAASEKHLAAFERAKDGTSQGLGQKGNATFNQCPNNAQGHQNSCLNNTQGQANSCQGGSCTGNGRQGGMRGFGRR